MKLAKNLVIKELNMIKIRLVKAMMEMLSMLNASQLRSKDIISAHQAKRNVNYHHIPVNDKSSKMSPKILIFQPRPSKIH